VREPGLLLPRSPGVEHDHRGVVGREGGQEALEGIGLGDVGLPAEARHPGERGVVGWLARGGDQAERVVGALGDAPGGADAPQHVAGGLDADRGRDRDDRPTRDPHPELERGAVGAVVEDEPHPVAAAQADGPQAERHIAGPAHDARPVGPGPTPQVGARPRRGVAVGGGDQRRRERGRVVGAHGPTEAMASSSSAARRS